MPLEDPVRQLINAYHELNAAVVDELRRKPSSVDFLHYVLKNRPFVIRQGAGDWKATREWDAGYLLQKMQHRSVNVACTPNGNADAIVENENGGLIFVEPLEQSERFEDFLQYVQTDTKLHSEPNMRHVKYAQTQNDNLRNEYLNLFPDVPSDISFATLALKQEPEAVNFWLGNERSVTSLHKDNYENIYVQVRGQKHFVLLPPVEMPCVNEKPVPFARYEAVSDQLLPQLRADTEPIPAPTWDPDDSMSRPTAYSLSSKPMRVTLNEGDMMYLPATWYHKVSQSNGQEGFSCSVNYWYDMSYEGSFWAQNAFLRDVVNVTAQQVPYPSLRIGDQSEDEPDAPTTP